MASCHAAKDPLAKTDSNIDACCGLTKTTVRLGLAGCTALFFSSAARAKLLKPTPKQTIQIHFFMIYAHSFIWLEVYRLQ